MFLHHEALFRNHCSPRALHTLTRFLDRAFLLLSLILVFAGCQSSARAQTETPPDEPDVLRVRTDLVTVPLFVTDRVGRRVFGLTQNDFDAQVDGHTLKLEYFAAGTERVALAFALDASGSAREIIRRQSEAALALLARFGPQSRVAIWRFGARPQLVTSFTDEIDRARTAFNLISVANERTAIFDAAIAAVRDFDRSGHDPAERRILILISDGLDTASRITAQAVISEAQQRGVSIYVIHLPLYAPRDGQLRPRPASKGFRALAEQTGGRYFMAVDKRAALDPGAGVDLGAVFKMIEEDLRGQYVLGFYPDDASRDARFHRLSISLKLHSSNQPRVRQLREGYTLKQ